MATGPEDFDLDPVDDLYKILSVKEGVGKLIADEYDGLETIAARLKTDLEKGLSTQNEQDLAARRLKYGENIAHTPPPPTFFALFIKAFGDTTLQILTVAAAVALIAGILEAVLTDEKNGWIEGVAILVAVLVVASVASGNDYNKSLQFEKLKKETSRAKTIKVMRDGEEQTVGVQDLVVGDVVALKQGNQIPVDGLFIPIAGLEGNAGDIMLDESEMTGEPLPQRKNLHDPILQSGCKVLSGNGHMLTLAVGPNSSWGKLIEKVQTEDEETPLQNKLERIVLFIGKIGLGVAIGVFIVLIIYWFVDNVGNPSKEKTCTNNPAFINRSSFKETQQTCADLNVTFTSRLAATGLYKFRQPIPAFDPFSLIEVITAFIIGITILVVAVPEGLPLAVTISLAYSMRLMQRDQNLVRHLSACETMGGADDICSDKTGTLTQNRMTVKKAYIAGKTYEDAEDMGLKGRVKDLMLDALVVNIENAQLEMDEKTGKRKFSGLPTECCLLVLAENIVGKEKTYKDLQAGHSVVHRWGFTSARKKMSTIIKCDEEGVKYRLFGKGAAERILAASIKILTKDGTYVDFDKANKKKHEKWVEKMAKKGYRTLSLGYRDFSKKEKWADSKEGKGFEDDFILIGIVAIEDPLRPEVPEAVFKCQVAGITVRMVTGDNILTAKKIARECGILTPGGIAMEGPDFHNMEDDDLVNDVLPKLQVLARSQPDDKHRLVTLLKTRLKRIVSVTGDGTNDAPALKASNVGLAMGSGTSVAQESADIIILDDNFASIVKAVMWGRCVFDNIRKFIQFQLTVNIVALIVAFVGAISRFGTPLTAIQLLWVNLIMDSFAALALGTEKPYEELLWRKPYGAIKKIVTPIMWRNIVGQSIIQVIIIFLALYALDFSDVEGGQPHLFLPGVYNGQHSHDPTPHYTLIFNTFVWLQLGNEINSRILGNDLNAFYGLHRNYLFIGVIIFTAGVQILLIFVGNLAFNVTPISGELWAYSLGGCVVMLLTGLIWRFIPVPEEEWEKVRDPEKVRAELKKAAGDGEGSDDDDEDDEEGEVN